MYRLHACDRGEKNRSAMSCRAFGDNSIEKRQIPGNSEVPYVLKPVDEQALKPNPSKRFQGMRQPRSRERISART